MTKIIKGCKIRLYPTKEQEQLFIKHIGACRFVWNHMLAMQQKRYENGEKYLSTFSMNKELTALKKQDGYRWMCEYSNKSLQKTCHNLDRAYQRFFKKKAKHPKFKSKKSSKQSFPVDSEELYFKDDHYVHVQKFGRIRYKTDFTFRHGRSNRGYMNATISYHNHKWMLTFSFECENQAPALTDTSMGIDLGIKEQAVVEFGGDMIIFHNINNSAKMRNLEKRRRCLQRRISRKYEANRVGRQYKKTNNIRREEEKLQHIFAKQSNIRMDYLHQITSRLIAMSPRRIVVEDLNVSGMLKNRHLSRAVSSARFGTFIQLISYKAAWNDIDLVKADRFYPSSKTCSCCGSIKNDLTLRDRVYVCNKCGLEIDRDYNAAINLSRYVA